ncbi:hypothetical protein AQUCO_00100097v1 [Aquilegia coerulea]|uniref:Tetraspanin n=1 Tax=Aquilegia coerulea TaxID=218851 RepID=A0A2G5F8W3_AQUCA|nr:hypothetical protein AQUCO_00100097v1 [Aquilegia coerulea]
MALSNIFTLLLNSIFLLYSTVKLLLFPLQDYSEECLLNYFHWYRNIFWIFIFLVAFVGVVGAFSNNQGLLALYLFGVVVAFILLLTVLIFGLVVTSKDGSYKVPGCGYKEYRLDRYSHWLRNHVTNSNYWLDIVACLVYSDVCNTVHQDYPTADRFLSVHLSPIQSGCCKPPSSCGFKYVKTFWINATNPTAAMDCQLWGNKEIVRCYNCDACKAGILGNLIMEWKKTEMKLIVALVVLVLVYLIGWCDYKNAENEHK